MFELPLFITLVVAITFADFVAKPLVQEFVNWLRTPAPPKTPREDEIEDYRVFTFF